MLNLKKEVKEIKLGDNGEKVVVMKWPTEEDPDKGFGGEGFEPGRGYMKEKK